VRTLFLLLFAAGVGFFAWTHFFATPDPAVDPQPLTQQIQPERLRVVEESELARMPPAAAAKATPPPVPPEPAPLACLEWGSFSPADAVRAEQRLEPLALGERLAQYRGEETAGWWVFLPPQANRAAALKKAAELKKLGVDEYFVVQEAGRQRWAVSLGVFRSEEAAQARLGALRALGVKGAAVAKRETRVPKVWFQARTVDAALYARLQEIAKEFQGATLHECAQRG
jgi:hypothetical protein